MIGKFNITITDVRDKDNWAIRHASKNGHFNIIIFLDERFNLFDDDFAARDNYAYRSARARKYRKTANWIARNHFLATISDEEYIRLTGSACS